MTDDPRRRLPALTALLARADVGRAVAQHGHDRVVAALRAALDAARERAVASGDAADADALAATALDTLTAEDARALRPVVNATGVVLHTNLGRAPLSEEAIAAVTAAARATNLELELATGRRGGRGAVAQARLARLCAAEDAVVVNNGAAALVLVLGVLAAGREVIVSRGELVEIGGSFRLPEIMARAGVRLREVGTTNRTHLDDYRAAVGPETGAVLRVHPSNFWVGGFAHRPSAAEVAAVAGDADLPLVHDIGSGLLRPHGAAPGEPTAAGALAEGADLVIFSGDKLLGGPQAGVVAGHAGWVARCRRDPLARALRLDKLRIAALEATLASHERDAAEEQLPACALAAADPDELRTRARRLAAGVGEVVAVTATLGGGSAPGAELASWGVALPGDAEEVAARLRTGDPPVVARIVDDRVVVDLRSVAPEHDEALARRLAEVRGG